MQRGQEMQTEGDSSIFVNAAGDKEGIKPVVVWTSENP